MTILVFGENTSSLVTCLDLLRCANHCRAFSKERYICMLAPLSCCPICSVLAMWEPEHRRTDECATLPVMTVARVSHEKPDLVKTLDVSS